MGGPSIISRPVESLHAAQPASDGAGVRLWRNLGPELHRRLDPFLMLDEFHSDRPDDYVAGFPDHPHRGFETVTWILAGRMEHRDSVGNRGELGPGDVQWMKAARGVIHSEMPRQERGLLRGFQLWLNLPAAEKMDPPAYEDIRADRIPGVDLPGGGVVRVLAGTSHGTTGPAPSRRTEPIYLDVELEGDGRFAQSLPDGHNAFVYVYEGRPSIGGTALPARHLAVLGHGNQGDGVVVEAAAPARLLLIAGRPLHEPVVQHGPFVMNTRQEILEAFEDYRRGRLGRE
jgi:redox-sensitive bicupin YhaK (pirin superfamily)